MLQMNGYKNHWNLILIVLVFIGFGFISVSQNDDWNVPAAAKNMKNPEKATSQNISIGKSLYSQHCASCHGKTGEGDGKKAGELDTFPGDFTSEEFQTQTDGELYYKTTEGRDDMPSFKKKLSSDEDRWLLVHYMRTFK